jgi:hypothetical protein
MGKTWGKNAKNGLNGFLNTLLPQKYPEWEFTSEKNEEFSGNPEHLWKVDHWAYIPVPLKKRQALRLRHI